MVAGRDIAAGEQLYNSYGTLTPEIFRDYGFVEQLPQRWYVECDKSGVRVEWRVLEATGTTGTESVVVWVAGDGANLEALGSQRARQVASVLQGKLRTLSEEGAMQPLEEEIRAFSPNRRLAWSYRTAFESAMRLALAKALSHAAAGDSEKNEL